MKHYFIPTEGNWYKANLHCHSTCSDGKMTPEEIKERYKSQGYSVVAYSDHNVMIDHSDLNDENFLALTAYEVDFSGRDESNKWHGNKQLHLNMIAPRHDENRVVSARLRDDGTFNECNGILPPQKYFYNKHFINKIIAAGADNGYLVTLNHPSWSLLNVDDVSGLERLWGVEVNNGGCYLIGHPEDPAFHTKLLHATQYQIFPIGADDNHSNLEQDNPSCSCCKSWVNICAEKLDYATIFEALKRGDFYASDGPEIYECYYDDEEKAVHVKCSPAVRVVVGSAGIGSDKAAPAHEGETITEAVIPLRETTFHEFLKVTVVDDRRRTAQTKAIWLK